MRFLVIFMIFTHLCLNSFSQQRENIKIYFHNDDFIIDSTESDNATSIARLCKIIKNIQQDTLLRLMLVDVESYTSPDGGSSYNNQLSNRRLSSICKFLTSSPLNIPDSLIAARSCGIAWEQLRSLVDSSQMPYKSEVIDILENTPEESWKRIKPSDRWLTMVDSRNRRLMNLHYGNPYRYMRRNMFPKLRSGVMTTIYYTSIPEIDKKIKYCTLSNNFTTSLPQYTRVNNTNQIKTKPLFALKTNLLFDLVTLINLEFEVPIKNRWSIASEIIYPWWVWDNRELDSKRNRIEILNGNIEGRYWWGERENRPILTGWFTGLYGGGGLYDLERKARGYQGEFFIAAGLSGGYAHTINRAKTLRMEYALGVGYLKTRYRYYEANCYFYDRWHPVEHRRGTYTWIGPTRLKVSLSWLINYKTKR